MQKISKTMRNLFLGMIFGISNVIPGVCSATVAYSTGIYEDVLDGISTLYRIKSWRKYYLLYLGIVLGILLAVVGLDFLFEFMPFLLQSIFLGVVIRGYPIKLNIVDKRSRLRFWYYLGGLMLVMGSSFLGQRFLSIDYSEVSWKMVAFTALSAWFSAIALILPGLSGALMLLTFGLYFPLLKAIKEVLQGMITFQFPSPHYLILLGIFACFFIISMISFSSLMNKLLHLKPKWLSPSINGMIMGSIMIMLLNLVEIKTTWYQYAIGLGILAVLYLTKRTSTTYE